MISFSVVTTAQLTRGETDPVGLNLLAHGENSICCIDWFRESACSYIVIVCSITWFVDTGLVKYALQANRASEISSCIHSKYGAYNGYVI